jgi:hypothetical protein
MVFIGLSLTLLLSTLLPITTVLVTACVCIWLTLHPRRRPFEDAMLPPPIPPLITEEQKEHSAAEIMV